MRLIDVDKLPATCNVAIVNGKLEIDGWIAAKRIIEAPTVDAIPVEWIGEWIRMPNTWARIFKKYDEEDDEFLESALHDALYWMIKDWEKENEPQLSDEAICSIMENDMLYEKMERLDKELIKDWERENGNIQDK